MGGEVKMEPQRTTEDLWAVSAVASPTAKLDLRADQLIKRGTQVVSYEKLADRWVITVLLNGKHWAGVTFRNPFGITRGELLGPRFALAGRVKIKVARGKVPVTVEGKHLTPCSVERVTKRRSDDE